MPLSAGAVAGLALGAALLVAGCGGSKLDTRRVEARLRVGIAHQGIDLKSVRCPRGVKAERGLTFTCRATDRSGQTAPLKVRQLDGNGHVRCTSDLLQGNLCRG